MKKEYLILIALILILGAYLLSHKENQNNYTLPQIESIDISKITSLVLDKKEGQINFTKKEDAWLLTDKGYPADSSSVENMLNALKTLKLSALVSQKGDLKRYELDDASRIFVKAMKGQEVIFEFTMGKTAPSFNHTFVMLADDKNIYHAAGSFRSSFDKAVADFRDKKVVEFKKESLKRLTIEKDGLSKTLVSKEEKKDNEEVSINWEAEDGTSVNGEVVSDLISAVSFLECDTYLEDSVKQALDTEPPLCRINLETDDKIQLNLFSTDKEGSFKAVSSMNGYAFMLSTYTGKEIVSNIETLLGIEKSAEGQTDTDSN